MFPVFLKAKQFQCAIEFLHFLLLQLIRGLLHHSRATSTINRRFLEEDLVLIREKRGGGVFLADLQGIIRESDDGRRKGEEDEEEELGVGRGATFAMAKMLGYETEEELVGDPEKPEELKSILRMLMQGEAERAAEAMEVSLWGPKSSKDLRRWLDVERAQALSEILRRGRGKAGPLLGGATRVGLREEARARFLVSARPKTIRKNLEELRS